MVLEIMSRPRPPVNDELAMASTVRFPTVLDRNVCIEIDIRMRLLQHVPWVLHRPIIFGGDWDNLREIYYFG